MESTTFEQPAAESEESQFDEAMVQVALETFRSRQNLLAGTLAGLVAAVAGAAVWAVVTVVTGYQIGWMAVGVGFLVGFAMRIFGKGLDTVFGVVGAALALLGCLLGNFFTVVHFVSEAESLGFFETLRRLNPAAIPELMAVTFSPIDLLFYGIALYEGYKIAFRQIGQDELERAIKGASVGITIDAADPLSK